MSKPDSPLSSDDQTDVRARGLRRKIALLLGGLVLCIYVALLLGTTYLAQRQLVASTDARQALELELRATALSYFYAERRSDMVNLGRSRVVSTFFANRDLGMSMAYGLRASLLAVRDAALELLDERHVGERYLYRRIVLLDDDGSVLADTSKRAEPASLGRVLPAAGVTEARVLAGTGDHQDEVLIQAPVVIQGRRRGSLVAWVDQQVALSALVGLDPTSNQADRYRLLRLGDALSAKEHASESRRALVQGTPFQLVALTSASAESGILTSRWLLAGFVGMAFALLAGGALILRFHAQNLVLHTRMEVERLQSFRLSRQNARLLREIERREESERRLLYQTSYDALTGLPNRALALDRLSQALERATREGQSVILLYLDLDHFKRVNDSLGHDAGDVVLQQVAERAKAVLNEGDTLARLAADEFLFIFPDRAEVGEVELRAARILQRLDAPFVAQGREIPLSACVGCAVGVRDGETADDLLKHADLAMKQAKATGPGVFRTYQQGLDKHAKENLEIASLLRGAADRGELELHFQPLMDLRSGKPVAAEALLRWTSPELGSVSPGRFIPVAEEAGLIRKLGAWVLQNACLSAAAWQSVAPCRVAVNVSSLQLQAPQEFLDCIEQALAISNLSPRLLELEITEGVLLADRRDIANLLDTLDGMGVHLSLDDFGTGYSALSYLRRFPFHVLKIDRSFIADVPETEEDAELTRAIVAMGQALGLTVLAEGVERAEQADFLTAAGCDLVQGFLYSRPLPLDAFTALIGSGELALASA
ncbi:EAL domain-containing protein [Thiorhodococcus mannitoliphagus]|uniref:EAL domain-containing protein n=1 Tax=Thiorhodococcus mannitoliphagus TaxID=329406 RepID=A0A6P1E032_9GAMM|nr:EAL domain-containing protein [Thiorhodococcus mannitoliphagus]NEX22641.1 EAL domain-containing protein [Thiorhodococcus mannitoliphagus]